jgi:PAS domain S-box-containing protein
MNWLQDFFVSDMSNLPSNLGTYNYWLVLLSIILAVAASFFSLHFASVARHIVIKKYKTIALISGSLVMAGGIWSMHFVGMLAYDMGHPVAYEPWLTLLSIIPSVIASYITLNLLIKPKLSPWLLVMSGTLVGLGIGTMHYMGMAAMEMNVALRYDPFWFSLSILVAVGLAIIALSTRYYVALLKTKLNDHLVNIISAVIMGAAISGMHYTGMTGARFIPDMVHDMHHSSNNQNNYLSLIVAVSTLLLSILATNISSQLRYRQLLQEKTNNELRLKTTLDTAVDGIITIDHKGLIQAFNKAAISIFGWQEEEVLGKNISMLMPQPYQEKHDSYLFDYQKTGKKTIIGSDQEVMALHKSGRSFPIRLGVGEVKIEGFSPLFVGFVTDISERRKMEDDLRQEKMKAEISADSKSSFLANMSHEIRTPMNAIIGFSDILLESDMSAENRKHLSTISKSGRSLLHLLNDILDSAKLDKNKLELDEHTFELVNMVDTVISTLWLQAKNKDIDLSFTIEDGVSKAYFGAENRMNQVLMNLLGNAIKFTEVGSVTLVISQQDNGMIRFSITDTGIGIPQARLKSIFEPFTQADASMSRRFGGTGLGTTISKQLVELMGGTIHATSEINVGSCFYFDIPLQAKEWLPEDKPKATLELSPKKILIADDINQNLTLLSLILKRQGHEIHMAKDGLEAISKFKNIKPDIILMDVQMPKMDGLAATQIIRIYERDRNLTKTPIIALTANVLLEDKLEAQNAGMDGFANKPIDINALTVEMARVLNIDNIKHTPIEATKPEAELSNTNKKQIHVKKGLGLWGDTSAYLDELNRFVSLNQSLSVVLSNHLKNKEFDAAIQLAHATKGSSSNLALLEITRQATIIESMARAKNREGCLLAIEQLTINMDAFKEELHTLNEAHKTDLSTATGSASTNTSTEALLGMIDELLQLTHAGEIDDEKLDQLVKSIEANERNKALTVKNTILDFDFDSALQVLLEMKETLEGKI